jgi:hypothetical protein
MTYFDKTEDDAKLKCIKEFESFLKRWEAESDLESYEILQCVNEAVDNLYEDEDEDEELDILIELEEEEDE